MMLVYAVSLLIGGRALLSVSGYPAAIKRTAKRKPDDIMYVFVATTGLLTADLVTIWVALKLADVL